MKSITETSFTFPNQTAEYHGKVRDVYTINHDLLVMIASDRISAFDVILPKGIPFKGQVLTAIASHFLDATEDIVPNWKMAVPHPNVTAGKRCEPYMVEMVIRGYLAGHAWREYKAGKRMICGVPLPEGLKENDRLPEPIITPATKAIEGHDEDISREEILKQGIVKEEEYIQLESYTKALFQRGTEMAKERGLILVDTKYEFGNYNGEVTLIDEIHTPDSSRYFYLEGFEKRQSKGEKQKQLSKEFVREWLMENGFQGKEGDQMPVMSDAFIKQVSKRYIQLHDAITGKSFSPKPTTDFQTDIHKKVVDWLKNS